MNLPEDVEMGDEVVGLDKELNQHSDNEDDSILIRFEPYTDVELSDPEE